MKKAQFLGLIGLLTVLFVVSFPHQARTEEPDIFAQAQMARQEGKVDEAYRLFEESAQKGIRPHDAYYEMGLILMEKEQYLQAYRISGKAVKAFQDYLEKNPQDDNAWFRLAYIYEVRSFAPGVNDWKKAIEALQKALAISPENSQYLLHLGYVYYNIGKNDEAEKVFLGILDKQPEYYDVRYWLAKSYLDNHEQEKAREQLGYIVSHAPPDSSQHQSAEKELIKLGGETQ